MKKNVAEQLCFLLFLVFVSVQLSSMMYQKSAAFQLSDIVIESDQFRKVQLADRILARLSKLEEETTMTTGELLTVLLPWTRDGVFQIPEKLTAGTCVKWKKLMLQYNSSGFMRISQAYSAVFNDIRCFPVYADGIAYENSWMFERTYGGRRGHEGTDLMPPENLAGHYRIVSMTDGVVEKIGWLPQGGYRIGIRSPSGGYFYYAHLDAYAEAFQIGDRVEAGTLLGWMGDTGYGPEGTRGEFDVHLHLGIYIATENAEELSVNPYWVLRYLQYRPDDGTA